MGHIELAAPIAHIWYTRRSPSYLGLILNISQRNLDRVLYFAQYIITEIDEDARQKALRRLDEELSRETAKLDQSVEEGVRALEATFSNELQQLAEQHDRLISEFEEKLTSATNELMSKAAVAAAAMGADPSVSRSASAARAQATVQPCKRPSSAPASVHS